MTKPFPNRTVEDAARAAGLNVSCLWQIPGPKDTAIAWMECLSIGHGICIVQTFDNGGWNALTDCRTNEIAGTIADVLDRCQPVPAEGAPVNLLTAVKQATDDGTLDRLAADVHPDIINAFCDAVAESSYTDGGDYSNGGAPA